jgi:predicted lysophospholipase L1 biosynthesis ABC-type transport system permease subunit
MTALSPGGSWTVIGALAFTVALVCLAATVMYVIATARQDREEQERPERRGLVSIEEAAEETHLQDSKVGLVFTLVAILVVIVLATLGV